eukprot:gene7036-14309_t
MFGGEYNHIQKTLLNRSWVPIVTLSLSCFLILQSLIYWNHTQSSWPICNSDSFSSWTLYGQILQTAIFLMICLLQCVRIIFFNQYYQSTISTYMISLCVNLIAGGSSLMTTTWEWGGICTDNFGVKTPATIWNEWIVCVPLLYYIAISIDNKPYLSRQEYLLILLMASSLGLGYLIQIKMTYCKCDLMLTRHHIHDHSIEAERILDVTSKRISLVTMDAHLEVGHTSSNTLLNERKRRYLRSMFLKNVFTEMRTPLRSVLLGIELLTQNTNHTQIHRNSTNTNTQNNKYKEEALLILQDSSAVVDNLLGDIISIHNRDEDIGDLIIDKKPIIIRHFMRTIVMSFQAEARMKEIDIIATISPEVPYSVSGDQNKLTYVLANLFSNALKFSDYNKKITVEVTADDSVFYTMAGTSKVTFLVRDEGVGIPPVYLRRLFDRGGGGGGGGGIGIGIGGSAMDIEDGSIGTMSTRGMRRTVIGRGTDISFEIPFEVLQETAYDNNIITTSSKAHEHIITEINPLIRTSSKSMAKFNADDDADDEDDDSNEKKQQQQLQISCISTTTTTPTPKRRSFLPLVIGTFNSRISNETSISWQSPSSNSTSTTNNNTANANVPDDGRKSYLSGNIVTSSSNGSPIDNNWTTMRTSYRALIVD